MEGKLPLHLLEKPKVIRIKRPTMKDTFLLKPFKKTK